MARLKPLEEAQLEILGSVRPLPAERVSLAEARGRVLAEKVRASGDLPAFRNSAMDGYALMSADTAGAPVALRVAGVVAAGERSCTPVEAGCAVKIMTGGLIPPGADAVAPVESTVEDDRGFVTVAEQVAESSCIREAGEDLMTGDTLLERGSRLEATDIGLLAAIGVTAPRATRRPRVAVLSTGDEVVPTEADEVPLGSVRDANRPMLRAMLEAVGAEVADLGVVCDDPARVRDVLCIAAGESDAIVASGGVSMGDMDAVKQALRELGSFGLWKIAVQPGKPFAFGFHGTTPLFGLPGNPGAVVVAFEQLVRPALLHMMGSRCLFRPRTTGVMGVTVDTNPEKTVFLRVMVRGERRVAHLAGSQSSGVLSSMVASDAFAVIPRGIGSVEEGEPITLEMFRERESLTAEEGIAIPPQAAGTRGAHRSEAFV